MASNVGAHTTGPQPPQQPQGNPAAYGRQPTATDVFLDFALRFVFDFVQRAMAAPFDRMMVLTATEGELKRQGRLPATGFGGVWGCVKRVWRKEGLSGFFRGLGTDFALTLPSGFVDALATNAVFLLLQRFLPKSFANHMTYTQMLVVSSLATVVSVVIATPYNALRKSITTNYTADIVAPIDASARGGVDDGTTEEAEEGAGPGSPAVEGYRYATATETVASIARRQGWRAFYRGAVVDPILMSAYRGVYISTVALVSPDIQMAYPSAVARGMAVIADVLTQPLEVVSRRLLLTASDDAHPPYEGMLGCLRTIAKEEGVTALWSGLKFRLITSAVTVCISALFASGGGDGGGGDL